MEGILKDEISDLIKKAMVARERAYAPYSQFTVGAALLGKNNEIYTGCNIENVSFGPSNCAERTAFFKAISQGEREFKAIAIVGGKEKKKIDKVIYPCGVCRQVMLEFCNPDFQIICAKDEKQYEVYRLDELLPKSFQEF